MADDSVQIKFGADTSEALGHITQIRYALQGLENPIRGIRQSLGQLAEAFIAAFAVEKIAEFVEKMADLGLQTERNMAILGLSAKQVGELGFAAKASGTTLEELTLTLERMTLNIQKSQASGFSPAAIAMKAFGLSAKELIGLPLVEQLGMIADASNKFNDSIQKTDGLMAIGGRGISRLIPMLKGGSNSLKEFAAMADLTGSVLTDQMAKSFAETHLKIIAMQASIEGLGIRLFSVLKPAFDLVIQGITKFVQSLNAETVKQYSLNIIDWLTSMLIAFMTFFDSIGTSLDQFLTKMRNIAAFGAAGGALGALFGGVGAVPGAILGGVLGNYLTDLERLQTGTDKAAKGTSTAAEAFRAAMQKIRDAVAGGGTSSSDQAGSGKKDFGGLGFIDKDAIGAAMKAIDGQIKVLQQGLEQKKVLFDAEAKQFQITQDQKFSSLQNATQQEYEAELALLEKEKNISGMSATQQQEVNNKILELKAKHDTAMLKLDEESIAAQQARWTTFFGDIQGAFNSQLRGLLAGTTSWATAFKNILGDLVIKFIEAVEKMVFEWAAGQLGITTATTSGAAAQAAAQQAAMTATLPARAGKFMSDIMANAAVTFAGIFANLAPILGPLAAGPAEAGQATVLAQLANMPKYEYGTNEILRTGVAIVHEGEKITPAQGSGPYSGGQGGAVEIHVHVNAVDTQTGMEFVQRQARTIAREMSKHMALNPSTRPVY